MDISRVERSALRILCSVGCIPMVPECEFVWRSQRSYCVWIRSLSFFHSVFVQLVFLPPHLFSLSLSPQFQAEEHLWSIQWMCICFCLCMCLLAPGCLYAVFAWYIFFKCTSTYVNDFSQVLMHACVGIQTFVFVFETFPANGKFPYGPLHSHLNALILFFFPHSSLSSLWSSPKLFDTCLCVKQRRNWKYYMPQVVGTAFLLSPWQHVYNSFAFRLYLFFKALSQSCPLLLCLRRVLVKLGTSKSMLIITIGSTAL